MNRSNNTAQRDDSSTPEKPSGHLAAIEQGSTDRGEPASPSRERGATETHGGTAAQRNTEAERLYECLDCGAVTTEFSTECSECGATAFRTNIVSDEQKSPSVFQVVLRPLERLSARYNPYIPR